MGTRHDVESEEFITNAPKASEEGIIVENPIPPWKNGPVANAPKPPENGPVTEDPFNRD